MWVHIRWLGEVGGGGKHVGEFGWVKFVGAVDECGPGWVMYMDAD